MDTLRAFQLFLLTEMIRDADVSWPAEWQITTADLQAAKAQIHGLGFMTDFRETTMLQNWYLGDWYRRVLGTPGYERMDKATGLYSLRFRLPLWPSFDFEIHLKEDGSIWNKLGFSRAYNSSRPMLKCIYDLAQWRFSKDEIEARFGPPEEIDGWNAWVILRYRLSEYPGGPTEKYRLIFSYDLFQKAERDD